MIVEGLNCVLSSLLIATVVHVLCSARVLAQNPNDALRPKAEAPTVTAYIECLGNAASIMSLNVKYCVTQFSIESQTQSFRISAGIGVAFPQNGYIPVMGKWIFFGESQHLELAAGVAVLYKFIKPSDDEVYSEPVLHLCMT